MASSSGNLKGLKIVSIVGRQGSGKSTIGKYLAKSLRTIHVETSDVVRSLNKNLTRAELPSTGKKTKKDPEWLGKAIAEQVLSGDDTAVLTGAREHQVHKYLVKQGAVVKVIELVSDPVLRYQRLLLLGKVKNATEFLTHEIAETRLGVQDVMDRAPFRAETTEDTEPKVLAQAIKALLIKEGVID